VTHPLLKGSLRALSAFARSDLVDRYELHEPAKKWIARGTKLGAELLARAAKRAKTRAASAPPEQPFDLTPTPSQELVVSTMRRFAEQRLRRAAGPADDALGPPADVLEEAASLGLIALAIPEDAGGAAEERSPITWALIAEELARGDLGLALALLAPVSAAHLIVDHGTKEQRASWLPRLAGDTFVAAAPAMLEPAPLFDPHALATRAKASRKTFHITGEKTIVPLGRSARFFVVSAMIGSAPRLFVVERDRPGVVVKSEPTMGLRGADPCTLELDVEVPREALLGGDEFDHQRVIDLARLGWGALAVGQCQAVLELSISYCNDRVAFGEPISHRQSVAFMIADMAIELEAMRLLVWKAASRA
jgi:alkylation response protein AidB-like acyl-CoA dehydrogenase